MNIVDGRQKKSMKVIERFVTAAGWTIMSFYFAQVTLSLVLWAFNLSNFYHSLFIIPNLKGTLNILGITLLISLLAFLIIYLWGRYNFRRYAHLNRRKFPNDVTPKDIIEHFDLSPEIVEEMQNGKRIQLKKTIV